MKKKVIAMVMAAAVIATMAGCGSKGNSGSGSSDVALKVWCAQNQVDTGIMEEPKPPSAETLRQLWTS